MVYPRSVFVPALFLACLILLLPCCTEDNEESDNGEVDEKLSMPPDDGRLYAAAGNVVLTPTPENHPETVYLGGIFPPRLASGIHDDLMAAVLILAKGDEHVVIVSLDFLGFTSSRIREIQERIAAYGLKNDNILISSTHTHEAPDTMGVFGPSVLESGVSRDYMAFVQGSIAQLILQTWEKLTPVSMRAAKAEVNDTLSNDPDLIGDLRIPHVTVPFIGAAQFLDENGDTVATLINWHSHPEVMIQSTLISADFPNWTRRRMETVLGGTSVYISGAVGGLSTPTGVDVSARDKEGNPVTDDSGNPVYLREGTWEKTRSLGFVIAEKAIAALEEALTVEQPELSVNVRQILLPLDNIVMKLAFLIGILEFDRKDMVTGKPETCGNFGCSIDHLAVVRVGPVTLVTFPGETFPESFIGRAELSVDFGSPWGEKTFPAMEGILPYIETEVAMHMGLCGNEIGYPIPQADFHPKGHPDYYEEDLFFGYHSETICRETIIQMLSGM